MQHRERADGASIDAWFGRRAILTRLFSVAAAMACGVTAARAQRKLTKQEAEYKDTPEDIRMCATCSLFLAPHGCKVMEGEVKAEGWCKLFDLAD